MLGTLLSSQSLGNPVYLYCESQVTICIDTQRCSRLTWETLNPVPFLLVLTSPGPNHSL